MVELRQLSRQLGFEKIFIRQNTMRCLFISNNQTYFESNIFERIINYFAAHSGRCKLEEKNGKRNFIVEKVPSIKEAVNVLKKI